MMSSTEFDDEMQNKDVQKINCNDLKSVKEIGCQYFSKCLGGIWNDINQNNVNVERIRSDMCNKKLF